MRNTETLAWWASLEFGLNLNGSPPDVGRFAGKSWPWLNLWSAIVFTFSCPASRTRSIKDKGSNSICWVWYKVPTKVPPWIWPGAWILSSMTSVGTYIGPELIRRPPGSRDHLCIAPIPPNLFLVPEPRAPQSCRNSARTITDHSIGHIYQLVHIGWSSTPCKQLVPSLLAASP